MAAVNAADDDTAKVILLENNLLTLQPEGYTKSITIERFASEPVHDVIIQVHKFHQIKLKSFMMKNLIAIIPY